MSCFIMSSKSLMTLAIAVAMRMNRGYDFWGFDVPDSFRRALSNYKMADRYDANIIYYELYRMDAQAYNYHYADKRKHVSEETQGLVDDNCNICDRPKYQGSHFAVCPWHYQLAKLLDCWLYQTNAYTTFENPFRLAMQTFRDSLYCFIVQNSSEYIDAPKPSQTAIFHINTIPGEIASKTGSASYPEDFPHLRPGESFTAWQTDDGWEVETTLDGAELFEKLKALEEKEKVKDE